MLSFGINCRAAAIECCQQALSELSEKVALYGTSSAGVENFLELDVSCNHIRQSWCIMIMKARESQETRQLLAR